MANIKMESSKEEAYGFLEDHVLHDLVDDR